MIVSPVGSPECLKPLRQQSPGGPARTVDCVEVMIDDSVWLLPVWDRYHCRIRLDTWFVSPTSGNGGRVGGDG